MVMTVGRERQNPRSARTGGPPLGSHRRGFLEFSVLSTYLLPTLDGVSASTDSTRTTRTATAAPPISATASRAGFSERPIVVSLKSRKPN